VAWVDPSERVIVPNVPVTPAALTGPLSGGQLCAHVPLQLDVVGVSGAKEYSVKPVLLVSTVTPEIVAVFTVLAAAAAGLLAGLLAVPLAGEGEAPAELHATSATAAAAAAGSARSIRRRARPPLIRGALPLLPRAGIFRGVMTLFFLLFRFLLGNWHQQGPCHPGQMAAVFSLKSPSAFLRRNGAADSAVPLRDRYLMVIRGTHLRAVGHPCPPPCFLLASVPSR
jgi:hypothetical protein